MGRCTLARVSDGRGVEESSWNKQKDASALAMHNRERRSIGHGNERDKEKEKKRQAWVHAGTGGGGRRACPRMDGEKWQLQADGSTPVGPRDVKHTKGRSKQALERSRGVEGSILPPCIDGPQLVQGRSFFQVHQRQVGQTDRESEREAVDVDVVAMALCAAMASRRRALGWLWRRGMASEMSSQERERLERVRNIGISAHIDSGKTTLTERILFYTGRIGAIHEVRGKDGVGAKMDSMDLEREKGITIQSAATYTRWKDHDVNLIDTPGHVDFTVEVERALRVLDGAVLVLCGVGGVQSQSITVDRQMRRYGVPRLCFVNKLDRAGADPWKVIAQLQEKLKLHACAVQLPIGLEEEHKGVVDLVARKAYYFEGKDGIDMQVKEIPPKLTEEAETKRLQLVEAVAEVDDKLAESFLLEEDPTEEQLQNAIRRQTIQRNFAPVFMGSAFKNKGVQALLNGVVNYLPCPSEVENIGLDLTKDEERLVIGGSPSDSLVALAFKLEEGRYGQLTYLRMYQGKLKKGDTIHNMTTGKRVKIPRLVRMHSDEMEDVESAQAGDIVAVFGVDCSSGDTFTDNNVKLSMESIKVPEPVMSLAIMPKSKLAMAQFSKALNRFQREDPTFKVSLDPDTNQTIISGMGELHLEIYIERMLREYNCETEAGKPRVNFREALTKRSKFDYLHKKQTGGSGQYGRVIGYIEPLPEDYPANFEFVNELVGNNVPPAFIPAIEKGFREACNAGTLIGHPIDRVRVVVQDGAAHVVDSSELAFKLASLYAFRQAYSGASPVILEPIMRVDVVVPSEFQGSVIGDINKRKGMIVNSDQEADDVTVTAYVPLNNMFGYSTDLRSMTQGKGEFTMEYLKHDPVPQDLQKDLSENFTKTRIMH